MYLNLWRVTIPGVISSFHQALVMMWLIDSKEEYIFMIVEYSVLVIPLQLRLYLYVLKYTELNFISSNII